MTTKCPFHDRDVPFDAEFYADPYPVYTRLREEAPIHRICMPEGNEAWLVTRYEDVSELLKDRRLVRNHRHAKDYKNEVLPEFVRAGNLHMEDGEIHTRLRRFMNFAFTPKRIDALRPWIVAETDRLLDEVEKNGGGDLMQMIAAPLPITVTVELLGIPSDMSGPFRDWSDALLGGVLADGQAAGKALIEFVYRLVELKRTEPGDDLMSHWIHSVDEEGRHLSEQEIVGMAFFLVIGGYDTTVGSIGSSLLALLDRPDLAERLRQQPDLIPEAVEELLRWDGSAHNAFRRFALEDMTIAGTPVAKGETVILSISSANRDPRHFPEPDVLDFDREDKQHWAFGRGAHHCPGKELARIEMQILVERLLNRFPGMALADTEEEVQWRPNYLIRSPRKVVVTV
ncbi:cytochrome P450 [Streptomyces sp. JH14]|uniref:cytochrome P450 family protein n=1 Tax=Streptomyces sp. JH14 TaxID=2793630 RepID=UPI0023F83704|nr:cytochrome P450 [Streptomyces sp. JH14]MDF6043845.1 cytochrome P450 [Streptomyces sp. JH14]